MVQILLWKLILFKLVRKVTFQAGKKSFPFSLTQNVHHSICKSSTLVHIVSQLNPYSNPISLRPVLIIFYVGTGLPISWFLSGLLTTISYAFLNSPVRVTRIDSLIPTDVITQLILSDDYSFLNSSRYFVNFFSYTVSLYFSISVADPVFVHIYKSKPHPSKHTSNENVLLACSIKIIKSLSAQGHASRSSMFHVFLHSSWRENTT